MIGPPFEILHNFRKFVGLGGTYLGYVLPSPVLTIKKDTIVIHFPPQEVTEDCSLLKVYRKEFSQRPDH